MKNKKQNLIQEKGITLTDLSIAIIILMLLVGTMVTAFYNYYMSTTAKNREAIATNCSIDVMEQVKKMKYEDITQETVNTLVEQLKNGITVATGNKIGIPTPYTVTTQLQNYNQTTGNTDKEDRIKILTITVEYTVGKKTETLQMSRAIVK